MEGVGIAPAVSVSWGQRRRRVAQLSPRYPYAGELLRLYGALLDAQERAFRATIEAPPPAAGLAAYIAERVVADVVAETVGAGPPALGHAAQERLRAGGLDVVVDRWLAGEPQVPVEEYLARAAAGPVLEALGGEASAAPGARGPGECPRCGGRPQLAYIAESDEPLHTPPQRLMCCRCGDDWIHERMVCPACGERSTERLPIFADAEGLPHLRADACESCRRYLIGVDRRRDPEAVPVVDELVAWPIDLHMQERGFTKIVPNLMGI